MGFTFRIVKPAGKDTVDLRGDGPNKVAKFAKGIARKSGTEIRLGERGRMDKNRRP